MSDEDLDKTAFVSHLGTYRYKRMPFGLKNASRSVTERVISIPVLTVCLPSDQVRFSTN